MKREFKYTDEPMGKVKVITDVLPSPEELALNDETVKITISLRKTNVVYTEERSKKIQYSIFGIDSLLAGRICRSSIGPLFITSRIPIHPKRLSIVVSGTLGRRPAEATNRRDKGIEKAFGDNGSIASVSPRSGEGGSSGCPVPALLDPIP